MANGIRIDDLDTTVLPSRDHVVPAMKDGLTVRLTVGQILDLLGKVLDPDEVGSKALFAALNLSDLDDPEQARENLGATEVGDALFTAADEEAARGSIGATEVGDALFTAVNAAAARGSIGATGVGDALFTAASKAAARSAIDALGPSETADKAFRRGNILGTVSQVGGVPTGTLIEYGSNANGGYVRFADGTQICWAPELLLPGGITTAYGEIFISDLVLWTYPAAFVGYPVPSAGDKGNAQNWAAAGRSNDNPGTVAEIYLFAGVARGGPRSFQATAIGRWF